MTDQTQNPERPENASPDVSASQEQRPRTEGQPNQQEPTQPDFVGDDQRDEEDLRTDMDRQSRRPEQASEDFSEDINQDGADSISQSATGGLGNADPQINRPWLQGGRSSRPPHPKTSGEWLMTDPQNPDARKPERADTFTPETSAQDGLEQRMQDEVPRDRSRAHTHDEPDAGRLALGGAHPEAQPRKPQDSQPDGSMSGDHGQTRQPQSSGMVQPDGGVNQGQADRPAR